MGFLSRDVLCSRRALPALLLLAHCTLPSIHRDHPRDAGANPLQRDAGGDAAVSERVDPVEDSDAGPSYDPAKDPTNFNEDLETFQSLLPKAHLFAEWPMPDSAAHSKHKPSYTLSEQVVTDNVTKLRWQRDLPDVYPGCTGNYEFVGRPRGEGSGCSWEEAQAYCKRPELAKQLGGGTWRVPTKIELESLIDVSRINTIEPALDDFPVERIWSISPIPNPEGVKLAWAVDYMDGVSFDTGRYKAGRVRCVSSANDKGGAAPDYQIEGGHVRDNTTQLEWQRFPDSATRNWKDSAAYCDALGTDGGGWHLPSFKELLTIVDASRRWPSIQPYAFPYSQNERYWTSSEYLDGRDMSYWVDFKLGGTGHVGSVTDQHYARCVR